MSEPLLLVERIEFQTVKVDASRTAKVERDDVFPQLFLDFAQIEVLVRSQLDYPPEELNDPTHFRFLYGVKIGEPKDASKVKPPYCLEVEATGFFRYVGKDVHVGVERFRAVRFTGYQILYGAIREMVANITARGPHGLWHLPARNFHGVAKAMSEKDEAARQTRLEQAAASALESSTREALGVPVPDKPSKGQDHAVHEKRRKVVTRRKVSPAS